MEAANDGQEEVYIALQGTTKLGAGGAEHRLEPGVMAQVLIIGAMPGKSDQAPGFTELGTAYP
jgi:uncharacterized cupin superfamily protein